MVPGEGADRDRREGRAERRRPDLADRPPGRLGEDREAVEVGGLALVGRHAERGVALDVLRRAEAFARRELDVRRGDVVLEVDEGLAAAAGDLPERARPERLVGDLSVPCLRLEAARRRRLRPGDRTLGEAAGEREAAIGAAGDRHARRQASGHESRKPFVPDRPAPEMRGEMDGRVPAARHGEEIAVDPPSLARGVADRDAGNPLSPMRRLDHRAGEDREGRSPVACRFAPRIDDRGDGHAGVAEVDRRLAGVVIVGEDDCLRSRSDAEAVDVGAHRAGEHHPRPVVVAEDQRSLDRAGGEHRAARDDPPEPLPRLPDRRVGMIVDMLDGAIGRAVIDAEHRRAPHDPAVAVPGEFGLAPDDPLGRPHPVDEVALGEEPAAEVEVFVAEDHPRPGPACRERRREPRRPRADDQHVAEGVRLLVVVRVRLARGAPQPRGAPDHRLVELLPERRRPHEGLVVEAGAEERRRRAG